MVIFVRLKSTLISLSLSLSLSLNIYIYIYNIYIYIYIPALFIPLTMSKCRNRPILFATFIRLYIYIYIYSLVENSAFMTFLYLKLSNIYSYKHSYVHIKLYFTISYYIISINVTLFWFQSTCFSFLARSMYLFVGWSWSVFLFTHINLKELYTEIRRDLKAFIWSLKTNFSLLFASPLYERLV